MKNKRKEKGNEQGGSEGRAVWATATCGTSDEIRSKGGKNTTTDMARKERKGKKRHKNEKQENHSGKTCK